MTSWLHSANVLSPVYSFAESYPSIFFSYSTDSLINCKKYIPMLFYVKAFHNIMNRWLRVCIRAQYEPAIQPALQFVTDQGRMKFVRPIYK